MPTYEYRCEKCRKKFELLQRMSEPPVKKCPLCGGGKVERLIGAGAGLIFKGSGFYITDYKKPSASDAAKKSKDEKPKESKETKKPSKSND